MEECKECEKDHYFSGSTCKKEISKLSPRFRDMLFKQLISSIAQLGEFMGSSEEELLLFCRGKDLSHQQIVIIAKHLEYTINALNNFREDIREDLVKLTHIKKDTLKKMKSALKKSDYEFNHDFNLSTPANENELVKYRNYIDRTMRQIDPDKIMLANRDLETYI